jgi:Domain of unknown function (DUF4340)
MTVRGTLAMAAVFMTLVAYLVATRPADGPAPGRTMLTPPLAAATAVEIVRDGATTRFVRRPDGTWSAPGVEDLVDALGSLQVVDVLDAAPSDPSAYGLGADALRLRVSSDAGDLVALEIGATNPAGTSVYVRRIGSTPVLLVGALLRWELEKLRRVVSTTSAP